MLTTSLWCLINFITDYILCSKFTISVGNFFLIKINLDKYFYIHIIKSQNGIYQLKIFLAFINKF